MLLWIENQMAFFKLKEEKIIPFSLFFSESAQDDSSLQNTWNTSEKQRKLYWLLVDFDFIRKQQLKHNVIFYIDS